MDWSVFEPEKVTDAAVKAAAEGKTLNDSCPYPFGSPAGRLFKQEFNNELARLEYVESNPD